VPEVVDAERYIGTELHVDLDVNNLCAAGAPPSLRLKAASWRVVANCRANVAHRIRSAGVPGMAARIIKFRHQRSWTVK
jgi:hypothetical protein